MKKFLPIFGLFLLLAAEAKALTWELKGLSCDQGKFLFVNTCGMECCGLGTEECQGCPTGCISCHGIEHAAACSYFDGNQQKYIRNEEGTATAVSCDVCLDGYKLTAHTQTDGFGRNPFTVYTCEIDCPENCSWCTSPSTCTSCKSGYVLQNGQCVVKPACPANCAECDDSGVCLKCEDGYVLKNGACAVKPKTQVAFCPPDKTLSADLCCCISK